MDLIPVTELKQWAYCPRVVYYHQIMPGIGKSTYKMQEALRAQDMVESLEMRRTLKSYGLEDVERQFGIWLADENLGISGKLDLLLRGPSLAAVVDFKLTSGGVGDNHRMQLGGYSALVEAVMGLPVAAGFIYRIPDSQVFSVEITAELRKKVEAAITGINILRQTQDLPEPTAVRKRCAECEFANFCGDIW